MPGGTVICLLVMGRGSSSHLHPGEGSWREPLGGVGAPGREGRRRRPPRRLCHVLGQAKFGLVATDRKEQSVHCVSKTPVALLLSP